MVARPLTPRHRPAASLNTLLPPLEDLLDNMDSKGSTDSLRNTVGTISSPHTAASHKEDTTSSRVPRTDNRHRELPMASSSSLRMADSSSNTHRRLPIPMASRLAVSMVNSSLSTARRRRSRGDTGIRKISCQYQVSRVMSGSLKRILANDVKIAV